MKLAAALREARAILREVRADPDGRLFLCVLMIFALIFLGDCISDWRHNRLKKRVDAIEAVVEGRRKP